MDSIESEPLGAQVKKGVVPGAIADPFGQNEVELIAPSDGVVVGRTNLPLVHEGDALFHLAHHESKQTVARSLDDFDPEAAYESRLTSEIADEPTIVW